jgi:hypothetical protein
LGQVTCPAQRFWPLNQLPGRFFAVAVDLRNTLLNQYRVYTIRPDYTSGVEAMKILGLFTES